MAVNEQLGLWWAAAKRWLRARAPGGVWLAGATILLVLAWGSIDPFRLRQRLDWMVTDQFLRTRRPPAVHPDLLEISIDDRATEQLGFPVPRYALARGVRQVRKLGGRTVLIDILFTQPRYQPALDEATRWLVPAGSVITDFDLRERWKEVHEQYSEDQVLARELAAIDRCVIPFQLLSKPLYARARVADGDDSHLIAQLSDLLAADPRLDSVMLAERLGLSPDHASRLFQPALDIALRRLAAQHLDADASQDWASALAAALPGEPPESYLGAGFRRAFERVAATRVVERKATLGHATRHLRLTADSDDLQPPRHSFADAADTLGFFEAHPDADGTIRALPLVGHWSGRVVGHQAFLAALLHLGYLPAHVQIERGAIRAHGVEAPIPIDSRGLVAINWPMGRRRDWTASVPQLSLADLVELDRYEADLIAARHQRREHYKEMARLAGAGLELSREFDTILVQHRRGDPDEAAGLEQVFDQQSIPKTQQLSAVQGALQRASTTLPPPPEAPPEDPLVQYARAILAVEQQIPGLERAYGQFFEQLRPHVEGKLCLIGDTTTGSVDLKRTPVDGAMPGITVIAATVNTILTGCYLTTTGYAASVVLTVLAAIPLALLFLRLQAFQSGLCGVLGSVALLVGSFMLLDRAGVLLSPVTPVAGLLATHLTTTTYRWWQDNKQKRRIRRAFQHYLHPSVVEQVSKNPDQLKLGGEEKELTVLFSDIRGFSSISEGLSAGELVRLLNQYFAAMTELVFRDGGMLDKYLGDGIMAVYGAPLAFPNHAYQACNTALRMLSRLEMLQTNWRAAGLPRIDIGIGINSGRMVVGNMGSEDYLEYTVIGDEVNLASRLEGANKEYATHIIISESTWEHVKDRIATRELDIIQVKGKKRPTRIFEVLGFLPLDGVELQKAQQFEAGVHAYRERRWRDAIDSFHRSLALAPGDHPSQLYIRRCEEFLASPPPADWDGVYRMKTK